MVLCMGTLPRRDRIQNAEQVAAALGGRHWLLRVWKRITALRPALHLARRAVITVKRLAQGLRIPAVLGCPSAGCFRSGFMALRV